MNRRRFMFGSLLACTPTIVRAAMPVQNPSDVTTPTTFRWRKLLAFGDILNIRGERFGADADFTAVFPLAEDHVLLWVNHEFPPGTLVGPEHPDGRLARRLGRVPVGRDLQEIMGGSVIELVKTSLGWEVVENSLLARRISGLGPVSWVTGPAREILGETVMGTLSNCGGGITPWGTVLTCEENHRYHAEEGPGCLDGKIGKVPSQVAGGLLNIEGIAGEHYGWVVELDPKDPDFPLRRHTALGRFRHESAVVVGVSGQPVRVYMADDRQGGGIWRFTSAKKWQPRMGKKASKLLENGILEVAILRPGGSGTWVGVSLESPVVRAEDVVRLAGKWKLRPELIEKLKTAKTLRDVYVSEGALRVDAWVAGMLVGGTLLGRPEGACWDGKRLFVALTGSVGLEAGDRLTPPVDQSAGTILELEDGGEGLTWRVFNEVGAVFGNPDNLGLDKNNTLLVATDSEDFARFGANGLYRAAGEGWETLLLAPPEAEVCGPSVLPDGTIVCAIQHPVESWGESCIGVLEPA